MLLIWFIDCQVWKYMTRLIDCEVSLQESCLHVGMQVRQSHYFTEVNWYRPYIVVMVKSEKPMYTLRQCLNVQCEVASPNRSHKHKYVELALRDSCPQLYSCSTMNQSARLVGSVVLCWSPLTSRVLGVYFSIVEVQDTSCHIVGSSCWGDVWSFRNVSAYPDVATSDWTSSPVHPLFSRRFSAVFKAAKSMCSPPNIAIDINISFC